MTDKKSTNQNYLALGGVGEGSLYYAAVALGIDPDSAIIPKQLITGCFRTRPNHSDPVHCVVLVSGYADNHDAWWLVDYRESISDAELDERINALKQKVHIDARKHVRVIGTQDNEYRDRATARNYNP